MENKGKSGFNIHKEGLMPQEEMLEVGNKKMHLKIGIPSENHEVESRVPLTPEAVEILTGHGHEVRLEAGAGKAANYLDTDYSERGGIICDQRKEVFATSDVLLKVSPPTPNEIGWMKERQVLLSSFQVFTHCKEKYIRSLMQKKVTAIAYETVRHKDGYLPLLAPMSAVAGRMSIQVGAHFLEKEAGGRGVLLGGVDDVEPGHVVILGSGTVGSNAAQMAVGLGAKVTVLGRNSKRLAELESLFQGKIKTRQTNRQNIEEEISRVDLVIGAVLVPGAKAPKLITREMLSLMQKGSVIVDVSIDQGGCVETSRPTKHSDPVYEVDGIIHYCVANMPGAVPRTSTFALTNATLDYAHAIANKGFARATKEDPALKEGVNTYGGKLTNREVALAQERDFTDIDKLLK